MKIRNGFVSNSSSSSFVVLKDVLSEKQRDMIVEYEEWSKFFISLDEKNDNLDNLKNKFSYYDSDPWRIVVAEDYIFGETSMDNFSMYDFLNYIGVEQDYINWDDGYNDEPWSGQLSFIKMKQAYRLKKLNKLNNL